MAEPQPNPLRNPPPPELPHRRPGRPPKGEARGAAPAAASPPAGGGSGAGVPQAPEKRQLPTDPGELDRVLAGPRVEFSSITELVNQLCSVLPPKLPLTDEEKRALTDAGARVLYVHGANIDPLWGLGFCLLAIVAPRYVLAKKGVRAEQLAAATAAAKAA